MTHKLSIYLDLSITTFRESRAIYTLEGLAQKWNLNNVTLLMTGQALWCGCLVTSPWHVKLCQYNRSALVCGQVI